MSTLNYALNVRQTSYKSTPKGPQRHVDRSMTLESLSSSATEPTSGTMLAGQKQRTRIDRTCRLRDTISGQLSDHE